MREWSLEHLLLGQFHTTCIGVEVRFSTAALLQGSGVLSGGYIGDTHVGMRSFLETNLAIGVVVFFSRLGVSNPTRDLISRGIVHTARASRNAKWKIECVLPQQRPGSFLGRIA